MDIMKNHNSLIWQQNLKGIKIQMFLLQNLKKKLHKGDDQFKKIKPDLRHLRSISGKSSKFDVSSILLTSTGMAAGLSLKFNVG